MDKGTGRGGGGRGGGRARGSVSIVSSLCFQGDATADGRAFLLECEEIDMSNWRSCSCNQ